MNAEFWLYALLFSLLVIAALTFYAGKLLWLLKQKNDQQRQSEKETLSALHNHDHKVLSSVVIIVRAMKAQQCDYSEGCWRLCVLLDSLKSTPSPLQQFPAIFELYDKIKHLSILDGRKQLSKNKRIKQDADRKSIEAKLYTKVQEDIVTLHQYANEYIETLTAEN